MTGLFLTAWPSTVCGHAAMVASRPMTSRRLIALFPKLKTKAFYYAKRLY
jgi:hypothetical protein